MGRQVSRERYRNSGGGSDSTVIQDIMPDRMENAYGSHTACEEDYVLHFDADGSLLSGFRDGRICFTTGREIPAAGAEYLFSVGGDRFFLSFQREPAGIPGYEYKPLRELRSLGGNRELFAAFTAYHLWRWYTDNRFCGRCGGSNGFCRTERALQCAKCGHTVYPRINPAVIVGVIRGDCLLITRYRVGYAHNALVAGFTEIGETAEETVRREVMEETGVRVKNIRYYKSQPWGIAQDLLMGFFCEADGDGEIHMDQNELKYAEWVRREEIELQPNDLSLTNDMMKCFKRSGDRGGK